MTARPGQRRWPHRLRVAALLVIAGSAAAAIGYVATYRAPAKTVAAAAVLKTVEITSGNLTTTEKVDGSLVLSQSLKVLHRVEGQTSNSTAASTGSASAAPASSANSGSPAVTASADCLAPGGPPAGSPLPGSPTPTVVTPPPTPPPTTPPASQPTTTVQAPPAPGDSSVPGVTAQAEPTTTLAAPSSPEPTTTVCPTPSTPQTTTAATDTTVAPAAPAGGVVPAAGGAVPSGGSTATGSSSATSAGSTARVTQTVTSVIAAGTSVGLGDVLYTVDGKPVVALSGDLPAWRSLSASSTKGSDIEQLERSLVSLGYDPSGTVTVDQVFDARTKAMVKRWQTGLGTTVTGTVPLGSVVFLPTSTTVASVSTSVGSAVSDGNAMMTLAAATQQVVIDVPDGDEAFVVPGLQVGLGNGTGTVSLLRSTDRQGVAVVQAVVVPSAPVTGVVNGGKVKVTLTINSVNGVLLVPAQALLSHIDGTYAIQVKAADGTVSWHTVNLLAVSGSNVAIRGADIAAGQQVLVPV